MINSGIASEQRASSGVSILIRKDWKNRIIGYECISPKILELGLNL
jgi:hypothetical protein